MFKTPHGIYVGPTKFGQDCQNPAWTKFATMEGELTKKLALSFSDTAPVGAKLLLIGVGSGSAAFEAEFAHQLALLGFEVFVICIDPSKICLFTSGIDGGKVPFIAPSYATVPDFIKDRDKFVADITILSMIWPNPHFIQEKEGKYDMIAAGLIRPDYIVTMYSTSANNISGTILYSAAMYAHSSLYYLAFKGLTSELGNERTSLIEKLMELIESEDEKCDELTFTINIIKKLRCKERISPIWCDIIMEEVRKYITLSHKHGKHIILPIMAEKLDEYKRDIVIDAELKLIKLVKPV